MTLESFVEKWEQMESTCSSNTIIRGRNLFENEEIENLCCDLFIGSHGSPNYENIMRIKDYGFKVYPTESDSFGWLIAACERISTHSIVYFG